MNKKTVKKSLAYMAFFSVLGTFTGCQRVEGFFAETQDTGYSYTTVKRKTNTAPTVIYEEGNTSTNRRGNASPSRPSYNERSTSSTETNSGSMESSIPNIEVQSVAKPTSKAIVPTEAPAVPNMAPTFAP